MKIMNEGRGDASPPVAFTAKKKGSMMWGRSTIHFRFHPHTCILRYYQRMKDIPNEEGESASNLLPIRTKSFSLSGSRHRSRSRSHSRSRSGSLQENEIVAGRDNESKARGEISVKEARLGVGKQRHIVHIVTDEGGMLLLRDLRLVVRAGEETMGTEEKLRHLVGILNGDDNRRTNNGRSSGLMTGKERKWLESVKSRSVLPFLRS